MMEIQRTIKYDADRVKGFGKEVMAVPGCEQLEGCIQCGTCSGVCPLSIYMDYTPRQVMALDPGRLQERGPEEPHHLALRLLLCLHRGVPARNPHHRHHV